MELSHMANECFKCCVVSDDNSYFLKCSICSKYIHTKCLQRCGTPGDLLGDVFFEYTCENCAPDSKEIFSRQKLPWLLVIILAIFNLINSSNGLSNQGFFHWKTHIAHFIDRNWKYIFNLSTKKRKNWIGTISGILSQYSPQIFCSGQNALNEPGWWTLSNKSSPELIFKRYENEKKSQTSSFRNNNNIEDLDVINDEITCSRLLPYMGKKKSTQREKTIVQSNLMDFIGENLSCDSLFDNILQPDSNLPLLFNSSSKTNDFNLTSSDNDDDETSSDSHTENDFEGDSASNTEEMVEDKFLPRIIQVTNFQADDTTVNIEVERVTSNQNDDDDNNDNDKESEIMPICEKSKFTKKIKRPFPWTKNDCTNDISFSDSIISQKDERNIYDKLQQIFKVENKINLEIPPKIRRFYRKLHIRQLKNTGPHSRIFNLDNNDGRNYEKSLHVLDRFVHLIANSNNTADNFNASLLLHSTEHELFESPYTSRALHPFIYRSSEYFPIWLKLLCQIKYSRNDNADKIPTKSSIDFCYFRPYHIAGVNGLLQRIFWPGIDMSECLAYPDFTVVALYKKLIIGCAFLVPDVGYNEAYISFMAVRPGWTRAGIASFMLYHLTQTCMGKDITLHVSANNPAICLYQKFGFKIEEVVLDFYDKFIPVTSNQSRHAFFLRLQR